MSDTDHSTTTAVILAAGKGTRMKSERPKVLHEVYGLPMLRHVIDAAREAGADRVVVVVGHGRDQVRDAIGDDDIAWAVQEPQLGTGHALQVAREAVGDEAQTLLLLYGDVPLVRSEALRALLEHHRGRASRMTVLTTRVENPTGYGRILRDADEIVGIREELDASAEERRIDEINTGIYAFEAPEIFGVVDALTPNETKGEVYLTDAVDSLRRSARVVTTFEDAEAGDYQGVNSRADLARCAERMHDRILAAHMDAGVTIVDPRTTFIDVGVEIGADTVIHPCTVIRSGVRIGRKCEVGPFTHLRVRTDMADGSEVGNFTEVKNSKIGEGSKAKHLTYLGDAVLGSSVNIGAGTITANYDGVKKSPTVIGDRSFVGSGTVFVAPVEMESGATTGAGAVVVRDSRIAEGEVYAGVPAKKLKAKSRG